MWTAENRTKYDRRGLRYPSGLTGAEWQLIGPSIPPARRGGRERTVDMRNAIDGIMYIPSAGCQWRALPEDFPSKSTVHRYLRRWDYDGTPIDMHDALYAACRERAGKEPGPTACAIDSQSVKSAGKGGPRSIRRGTTRGRRSKARKGMFSSIRTARCSTPSFVPRTSRIATGAVSFRERCPDGFPF